MGCGQSTASNTIPASDDNAPTKDGTNPSKEAKSPISQHQSSTKKIKIKEGAYVMLCVFDINNNTILVNNDDTIPVADAYKKHASKTPSIGQSNDELFTEILENKWGFTNDQKSKLDGSVLSDVDNALKKVTKSVSIKKTPLIYTSALELENGGIYFIFVVPLNDKIDNDKKTIDELSKSNKQSFKLISQVESSIYNTIGHCNNIFQSSNDWLQSVFAFAASVGTPLEGGLYLALFQMKFGGGGIQVSLNSNGSTMIPCIQLNEDNKQYGLTEYAPYYSAISDEGKNIDSNNDDIFSKEDIISRGLEVEKYEELKHLLVSGVKKMKSNIKNLSTLVKQPFQLNNNTSVAVIIIAGDSDISDEDHNASVKTDIHKFNLMHNYIHDPLLHIGKTTNKPPMPMWIAGVLRSNVSTGISRKKRKNNNKETKEEETKQIKQTELERKGKELKEKLEKQRNERTDDEKRINEEKYTPFALQMAPMNEMFNDVKMLENLNAVTENSFSIFTDENLNLHVGDKLGFIDYDNENITTCFGEKFNMIKYADTKPIVVVAFRGSWCAICNLQLKAFLDRLDYIHSTGAKVIGVSATPPELNFELAEKDSFAFPLISDPDFVILRELGAMMAYPKENKNTASDLAKYYGVEFDGEHDLMIPIAGVHIFDGNMKVLYSHGNRKFYKRVSPEEVIDILTNAGYPPTYTPAEPKSQGVFDTNKEGEEEETKVEEAPKEEETKVEEEASKEVENESPKEEETKVEEAPKEEETKVEEEAPKEVENESPKEEEAPKEEETKVEEEAPKEVENESPKEEEAPKEEETKVEEEAPKEVENESPKEEEAVATE